MCYRWLARNRDKYPPGELLTELAKRVEQRAARAKAKSKIKPTKRTTRA